MATGRIFPGLFKTNRTKLTMGIWPWTEGLKSRLPLHYKKRFIDKCMKQPIPVHYKPDPRQYTVDKYGVRQPVPHIPLPLTFPPESHLGLWGGEGFVEGYKKRKDKHDKPAIPSLWKPRLLNKILYSEILDRWMEITVTKRTLDLIDKAFGFDNYILQTHEVDLQSKLGMSLKREMISTLAKKSMYLEDKEKQQSIYEKYKEFIIPEEEIEWMGLSLTQAENKLAEIEEKRAEYVQPLKYKYAEDLLIRLEEKKAEDSSTSSSVFKNPFKSN